MNLLKGNILKFGTYILVLLLPVIFWGDLYYPYISTKTFFFYAVVEILFFIWLYTITIDRSYRLNKKTLLCFIPPVAFMAWMTLAGILGANPHYSFWSSIGRGTGLISLYHCLAFAFIIASLVRRNGIPYIYSLFQYVVTGGFLLMITVLLGQVWLDLPYKFFLMSGEGGSLGNSSMSVVYLTFVVGCGLFLLFSKKVISQSTKTMISIVMFLILFSPLFIKLNAIFDSGSIIGLARGASLSVIVALIVFILIYLSLSKKKNNRIIGYSGIVIGIIFSIFLWHSLITPNAYLNKKFVQSASSSRLIFWGVSQKALDKHPMFGYGPENFRSVMQDNFDPKILIKANTLEGWSDKPHNIFYEFGAGGGYPGLILYAIFLLSLFYGLFKARNCGKINRTQIAILGGLLVSYIFQNLFLFDTLPTLVLLFLISAFIFGIQDNTEIDSTVIKKNYLISYLIPILLGGAFITSFYYFVYSSLYKTILYAQTFSMPTRERIYMYPELLKGSSIGIDFDVSGLANYTFINYAKNISVIKNDKNTLSHYIKNLEGLLVYLEKVSEVNKTDYRLYLDRVYLYDTIEFLRDGSYDNVMTQKMLDILDNAHSLAPNDPSSYWARAQVKALNKDMEGAEQAYKDAIAIEPKVESSHKLLI
ncbi:O-antigen ligase family protein, partial [Candidatus Nomurabacteria bacterium]|nr:O-antigen ligase family protein [Candidatus Nomurabacteria bacterium]